MTGNTDETINGDIKSTIKGKIEETINGEIKTTHNGNLTETLNGDQTVILMGNITESHNQGDVTFSRIGSTSETYMGTKTSATLTAEAHTANGVVINNFNGGYINATIAVAMESFAGAKIETHNGPKIVNKVNEIVVTKSDIKKATSSISKYTSNIINSAITMIG